MKRFGTVLTAVLAIIVATMVATPTPSYAHAHTPAVTNIQVAQGHNPGEVIVSWDAVPQVTHYRIGYVNMETDYPLAKASVTGEWLEAFVYVDVERAELHGFWRAGGVHLTPTGARCSPRVHGTDRQ